MSIDLAPFLAKTEFFAQASPEDLAQLAAAFETLSLEDGAVLFAEGDAADGWYLVVQGEIAISTPTADGGHLDLAVLQAGDGFGEIALLEGLPRSATATAAGPAAVARLPREAFLGLLRDRHPAAIEMLIAIATNLSGRVREISWLLRTLVDEPRFGQRASAGAVRSLIRSVLLEQ